MNGEDRCGVVRRRPEHDRAVIDDKRVIGIVLERRERHMLPLPGKRAAGFARREAGNVRHGLRQGARGERGAAERAGKKSHGKASGAQRVFRSRSKHVVITRPSRSRA